MSFIEYSCCVEVVREEATDDDDDDDDDEDANERGARRRRRTKVQRWLLGDDHPLREAGYSQRIRRHLCVPLFAGRGCPPWPGVEGSEAARNRWAAYILANVAPWTSPSRTELSWETYAATFEAAGKLPADELWSGRMQFVQCLKLAGRHNRRTRTCHHGCNARNVQSTASNVFSAN
jgi:hypothetical protein